LVEADAELTADVYKQIGALALSFLERYRNGEQIDIGSLVEEFPIALRRLRKKHWRQLSYFMT